MERADVVHVWADVGVRRVKGRLRPHRGVPLGRYPDQGDVGESRTSRQRRRPVGRQRAVSQRRLFGKSRTFLQFRVSGTESSEISAAFRSPPRRIPAAPHADVSSDQRRLSPPRLNQRERRSHWSAHLALSRTESHVTCTLGKRSRIRA